MRTTLRAAASVAMLAGFYVLAVGLIGGLGAATVWLARTGLDAAVAKLGIFTVLLAAGLVVALWKILRARPEPPPGLVLTERDAPQLWRTARALATEVGTRPPDEIRLVAEVNAAVSERTRLLGLLGGRRTMYLGMPLVQGFTVDQLRSVLAHELGHFSNSHTRLGALAYRGRATIVATIVQVGPSTLAGRLFRGYAHLYLLVEQAVSRRMEYEADRHSVRVAGRAAATSALRDLAVIDAAWDFFVANYVTIGWDANLAPRDVFGGFGHLLAGRAGELAKLRDKAPPAERSRWDSHPPIAARIAAMAEMPDPDVTPDGRPATDLLPAAADLAASLQQETLAIAGRRLLPWAELTDAGIVAAYQQDVDVLFRAAARLGGSGSGDLAQVLALVDGGQAPALARAVAPHAAPDEALAALAQRVGQAIVLAAHAAGVGRWRHSWSEAAAFLDAAGRPVPSAELGRLAVDPATTGQARERLTALGIDVTAVRQASDRATAADGSVLGAIANMKSGNRHVDVFVLGNGLLLLPGPKDTDKGRRRLASILHSAPLTELAGRGRFIAFEDIDRATVHKRVPVRVAITTHDGATVELSQPWSGETLEKGDDDLFHAALAPFVRD